MADVDEDQPQPAGSDVADADLDDEAQDFRLLSKFSYDALSDMPKYLTESRTKLPQIQS